MCKWQEHNNNIPVWIMWCAYKTIKLTTVLNKFPQNYDIYKVFDKKYGIKWKESSDDVYTHSVYKYV